MYRSYERPQQKATFISLVNSIKELEIKTNAGIYLGKKSTYHVDNSRLDKVVKRIVRGVYWHERRKIFPINGKVKAYTVESMGLTKEKADQIAKMLSSAEEKVIGMNAFKYRMAQASEEFYELWHLIFYEKVEFISILTPSQDEINAA